MQCFCFLFSLQNQTPSPSKPDDGSQFAKKPTLQTRAMLQGGKQKKSPKQRRKKRRIPWNPRLPPSLTFLHEVVRNHHVVLHGGRARMASPSTRKAISSASNISENQRNGERLRLDRLASPPETLTSKASPSRDVTSLPLSQSARTPHAHGPIRSHAPPCVSQSRASLPIARSDVIVVTSLPKHRSNRSKRFRTITCIGELYLPYFDVDVIPGKSPSSCVRQ